MEDRKIVMILLHNQSECCIDRGANHKYVYRCKQQDIVVLSNCVVILKYNHTNTSPWVGTSIGGFSLCNSNVDNQE